MFTQIFTIAVNAKDKENWTTFKKASKEERIVLRKQNERVSQLFNLYSRYGSYILSRMKHAGID